MLFFLIEQDQFQPTSKRLSQDTGAGLSTTTSLECLSKLGYFAHSYGEFVTSSAEPKLGPIPRHMQPSQHRTGNATYRPPGEALVMQL